MAWTCDVSIEEKVRQDCYNRGYEQGRKNPCDEIVAYIEELQKQVKEYRDKIENGTLVELPCKVCDTVYEVANVTIHCGKCDLRTNYCPNGNFRDGQAVVAREIKDINDYCYLGENGQVYLSDNVFLTREEAEKRLKELQNG